MTTETEFGISTMHSRTTTQNHLTSMVTESATTPTTTTMAMESTTTQTFGRTMPVQASIPTEMACLTARMQSTPAVQSLEQSPSRRLLVQVECIPTQVTRRLTTLYRTTLANLQSTTTRRATPLVRLVESLEPRSPAASLSVRVRRCLRPSPPVTPTRTTQCP